MHGDPALAFLTYDDESHRFAIANLDLLKPDMPAESGPGEIGLNHIAYTYGSAADLLETYARLKEQGLCPYWPVHHGFTLSFYYQDPDGNRIELQVESCNSKDAFDYMRSEAFANNPVGVEVDPEALLTRYRAGASEARIDSTSRGQAITHSRCPWHGLNFAILICPLLAELSRSAWFALVFPLLTRSRRGESYASSYTFVGYRSVCLQHAGNGRLLACRNRSGGVYNSLHGRLGRLLQTSKYSMWE